MTPDARQERTILFASMGGAAILTAFQVAARSTRDALFLASFDAANLPAMMVATSLLAIGVALLASRAIAARGPVRILPGALIWSALLLLLEWGISFASVPVAAVLLYLHYGCLGAVLLSTFWSLLNERYDPRTAKRKLGPIAAWGTLGGLVGGFATAQVAGSLPITAMLPLLAALHLGSAAVIGLFTTNGAALHHADDRGAEKIDTRSGLRTLTRSSFLQGLLALVLLTTLCEGFLDLALKTRADRAFSDPAVLLRFFGAFYTATSILTFLIQAFASPVLLERIGLSGTVAVLPVGTVLSSAGALLWPGLTSSAIARGSESVFASSLYRTGYEVFFTAVSEREKRSVKALTDVGGTRLGDLLAAGAGLAVLTLSALHAPFVLTALALLVAVTAFIVATRLHGGYVRALGRGLESRAIALHLPLVQDATTRSVLVRTLRSLDLAQFHALPRSGEEISDLGIDLLISRMGEDETVRDAMETLARAGPVVVEPLIRALLDAKGSLVIRRRVPLVLAAFPEQRVVEGLLQGLRDSRFEIRYRCARGLSRILERNPKLEVSKEAAYEAVLREIEAGVGLLEGRKLLDHLDDESWSPVMHEAIRDLANRRLENVFTLLALVHPRQHLRIAFRGLHVEDARLRGTALEYLETILPTEIREPLWPYLEDRGERRRRPPSKPPAEVLESLLASNESVTIHLESLRNKEGRGPKPAQGP